MSASFEFSAADAQAVPSKTALQVGKNPKLDISLDELINIEKKEKRDARKQQQQSKPKTEKRTTRSSTRTTTRKTSEKTTTTRRTSDRSKDITVKVSPRNAQKKKEFKVALPERVVRDLLRTAGVNTDRYNVSIYAIPRGRD